MRIILHSNAVIVVINLEAKEIKEGFISKFSVVQLVNGRICSSVHSCEGITIINIHLGLVILDDNE
jgi:hypothetical protein